MKTTRVSRRARKTPKKYEGSKTDNNSTSKTADIIDKSVITQITNEVIQQLQLSGQITASVPVEERVSQTPSSSTSRKRKGQFGDTDSSRNKAYKEDDAIPSQSASSDEDIPDEESNTALTITGAINSILDGESEKATSLGSGPTFNSASNPLGSAVSNAIKKKIWSNEYIDVSLLIKDESEKLDRDFSVTIKHQNGKPSIAMSTPVPTKRSLNINEWTDAMMVYGAIYTVNKPLESPGFFKYVRTVRDLSTKCQGNRWSYYDNQFRKLKATMGWSWGWINWELYFAVITPINNNSDQKSKMRPFRSRVPKGFCWSFHRDGSCALKNCSYSHSCYLCKKSHSASECQNNQQRQFRSNHPNSSKKVGQHA